MVTSLLFPSISEDEKIEENGQYKVKKSRFGLKYKITVKKNEEEKPRIEFGADWPIRLALSVGLSLGILGIVSWILNDLYTLNERFFGVRADEVVLSIFIITVVSAGGAIIRRSGLKRSSQEKFAIPKVRLFENDPKDIIITSILILILLGAIGFGFYLGTNHHSESERYTELFILGPDQKIGGYPSIIEINQPRMLHLGLVNNEFKTMNYDIVISLDYNGTETVIDDIDNLQMNRSIAYIYSITLDHGQRILEPFTFNIDKQGQYLLSIMILDGNGGKYREVKLMLTILEPENIIRFGSLIMYLADENGIPSDLPGAHWNEEPLNINLVVANNNITEDILTNATLYYGDRDHFVRLESKMVHNLNSSTVLFSILRVPAQSRYTFDFNVILPEGEIDLIIQVNRLEQASFQKTIRVH